MTKDGHCLAPLCKLMITVHTFRCISCPLTAKLVLML